MWQLESAATSASSGSTAASTDNGTRTTCGEEDAGTSRPPSKRQGVARLERLSGNAAAPRAQWIPARCSCSAISITSVRWCAGLYDSKMSSSDLQPRRDLTLTHATSLVVGIIIGTGVFLKTASMAQAVGTPALVLAA